MGNGATQISGSQIRNHTVTGKKLVNNTLTGTQIAESSLGKVPSAAAADTATSAGHATSADNATNATTATTADGLATLASGASESGMFSAGDGNAPGGGGWLGAGITYTQPLATPIPDNHIVDLHSTSAEDATCSGPGHAAPGYLCLYDFINDGISAGYGYSSTAGYFSSPSPGVVLYFPVTGATAYAGGEYTVTAS